MLTYSELINELKFYKRTHYYYQYPKVVIIDCIVYCTQRQFSSDLRCLGKFIRDGLKTKKLKLEDAFFNYTIDDTTLKICTYDYDYTPQTKPSVDNLLDNGYSLRQIQQIMKGEN